MRWFLGLVLTISLVLACGPKPPAERFYGDWQVDVERTLALDPESQNLEKTDLRHLYKLTRKWMQSIRFSFGKDGVLTTRYGKDVQRRQFTVKAVDTTGVQLETTDNGQSHLMVLRYKDGMMIVNGRDRPLVLAPD